LLRLLVLASILVDQLQSFHAGNELLFRRLPFGLLLRSCRPRVRPRFFHHRISHNLFPDMLDPFGGVVERRLAPPPPARHFAVSIHPTVVQNHTLLLVV